MKITRTLIITTLIAAILAPLRAEEGGSGHHLPGSGISLAGMLPPEPGVTIKLSNWYYNGDAGRSASLGSLIPDSAVDDGVASVFGTIAGNTGLPPALQGFADRVSAGINDRSNNTRFSLSLESTQNISTLSFLYVTPWKPFGGRSAVGVALPLIYVETDITFEVRAPNRKQTRHIVEDDFGLSDMVILPGIIAWDHGHWHWNAGLAIYAPTGDYSADDLTPLGKNFWSFEPFAGLTYLNTKNGIEASLGAAIDFNTTNHDTDYRSGTQVNLEWLVAQHLPGGFSVGVTGFYYKQISGDRGDGATNGGFYARTVGFGPTVGFTWKERLAINAQWFREVDVTRRLEGDVISVNASWTF